MTEYRELILDIQSPSDIVRSVRRTLVNLMPDRSGRWALLLIAIGALIRVGLLLLDWPRTDSDEGTMGLMALHILSRGEHPVFFYGQTYMGSLQAHLGSVLFALFGASVFSLRLGLLILFALFLAVMYGLLRLLYGATFALVSLALLDLGGPDLLKAQLLALGGYPETLLFGGLSLLVATALSLNASTQQGARWLQAVAYGGFGLILGLGWWSDPLVLPFLIAATLMVVVFCRHEQFWTRFASVALGLLVGLMPQIVYTIQHLAESGPTAVAAFQAHNAGTLAQLAGTLLLNAPDMTGAGWVCTISVDQNGAFIWSGVVAFACAGLRLGWSFGILALIAIASVMAVRAWRASLNQPLEIGGEQAQRRTTVLRFGRLALLLGGILALAIYAISPSATPPGHTRYLVGLELALPAIVYPLWLACVAPWSNGVRRAALKAPWAYVWAAILVFALVGGVIATYTAAPAEHTRLVADEALIADLEGLGIQHMYTDYWTCYKVAFLTRERITCAALGERLEPGNNRYLPYVADVQSDPRAAYVFPAGSPQATAFAAQSSAFGAPVIQIGLDGYVVYMPTGDGLSSMSQRAPARAIDHSTRRDVARHNHPSYS